MVKQANSDPMPYVQVDRAVKPKASLLAQHLGVTTQHAVGALVEWWELSGDPRELERIVAATPEGDEPAVVLDAATVTRRFTLAAGRSCSTDVLVDLGLLAPVGDRFRVRGMSRYFEPIVKRIGSRDAAAKGGRRSAEVRRATLGTAQPRPTRSGGASVPVRSAAEAPPKRTSKRRRSDPEAESNPSGQRAAVSGQHLEKQATAASQPPRPPEESRPVLALELVPDEDAAAGRRAEALEAFRAAFRAVTQREYVSEGAKDNVALQQLLAMPDATPEEVAVRARRGLVKRVRNEFPGVSSLAQLRARWNDLATPLPFEGIGPPAPRMRTPAEQKLDGWLAQLRAHGLAYQAEQFAACTPREDGDRLLLEHADRYFVEFLRDQVESVPIPTGWQVVHAPEVAA